MQIRERHYRRIAELVPRYRGDLPQPDLAEHLLNRFNARALLAPGATPSHPNLVPTADGLITRMLLTVPNYAVQEPIMAAAYQSLLGALPSGIRLVALVQESAQTTFKQWLQQAKLEKNVEISTFDDSLNISIWAEDGYVVATDRTSGLTYFVEPYSFPRYGDALVANFVCNYTDLKDTQAPLYFQGGNVLIGDDFFLIGADYPANSLQYIKNGVLHVPPRQSPQDFIKGLYRRYLERDRSLHYIGSTVPVPIQTTRPVTVNGEEWTETICAGNAKGTVQPLFHIDMFLTLVGRGDHGSRGSKTYRIMVGDPSKAYALLGGTAPPHAMQSVFDNIASSLATLGFDVIRNPLPLVYMDDVENKQRRWYFATANNALVQNGPTKEVWLPTYGHGAWNALEKTDNANKKLWEELGFTTHMLGDFHPFAENLGAVHCIKKYLARGTTQGVSRARPARERGQRVVMGGRRVRGSRP
jgi:hypothetical protein